MRNPVVSANLPSSPNSCLEGGSRASQVRHGQRVLNFVQDIRDRTHLRGGLRVHSARRCSHCHATHGLTRLAFSEFARDIPRFVITVDGVSRRHLAQRTRRALQLARHVTCEEDSTGAAGVFTINLSFRMPGDIPHPSKLEAPSST